MDEPLDPDRSRLLLLWLQARRALDLELGELRAAGPAGERRVRARFDRLELLEQRSAQAYADYRQAVRFPTPPRPRLASAREPGDDLDTARGLRPDF